MKIFTYFLSKLLYVEKDLNPLVFSLIKLQILRFHESFGQKIPGLQIYKPSLIPYLFPLGSPASTPSFPSQGFSKGREMGHNHLRRELEPMTSCFRSGTPEENVCPYLLVNEYDF